MIQSEMELLNGESPVSAGVILRVEMFTSRYIGTNFTTITSKFFRSEMKGGGPKQLPIPCLLTAVSGETSSLLLIADRWLWLTKSHLICVLVLWKN